MKVEKRTERLRIVRADKKTPGVLFGKAMDPVSLQVDEQELHTCLREYGHTKTFKIKVGTKTHQVYIKEIQRDIINSHYFLNFKLVKVAAGDTMRASVNVNIIGKENIQESRFEVRNQADTVELEYIVGSGISHFDVDVSSLKIGDTIYAKDLELPKGIELIDDPEKIIISINEITFIPEEVEESDEPELTEPELVGAKKEEE